MYSRSLSDKLKDRPRRALEDIRPLVGEDFVHPEPEIAGIKVAPRALSATRAVLWWLLVGSVIFFIAALAFFTYYFTLGGGRIPASPSNIDIVVTGPPQVSGGEPTKLQIAVTNRNSNALELADLVITYPKGTRSLDFVSDFPSQRISLGTIEPGGRRQGTVTAVFSGQENEKATVKVELEYRVAGSNSIFTASSDYALAFASSPLSISVEGNRETISGQPVQLVITVASNSSAPIADALMSADFPFGFKVTSATPKEKQAGLWELGDFAPGERKTITILGTLTGEMGDARVFHFAAGSRQTKDSSLIQTKFADSTYQINVSQPFLGLAISVNKESGSGAIVAPGDNVLVNVTYQNNLTTVISDAVIVARLSGITIDGSTVHTTDGFYRSSDDVVLWDKTTTGGQLASIAPGGKGTISFNFQMPSTEAIKGLSNPRLEISVNAAGKRLSETNVPQNLQSTARQTVKLASDLDLKAQGFYYASPFGSTGPIPPKAGTETTYGLVFTITNTTNKIEHAIVTAHLPPYVRWTGSYSPSSAKVKFNQIDGTVTWDIGEIPQRAGLDGVPPVQAAIAIGLTPSTSQLGQVPAMLQDIVLTGTDAATGLKVTRKANDITTNIVGDPGFTAANATVVR